MSSLADAELLTIPALAEIDWGFPERVAASGIESVHPYPAKFVAELPRALISNDGFRDETSARFR